MKQQLNLSIEKELVDELEARAEKEFRSKSNMLEVIMREAFAVDKAEDNAGE